MISLRDFKGAVPKRHLRYLPEGFAQRAVDTRLESGALDPVRAPFPVTTLPDTRRSLYFSDVTGWIGWDAPGVHAVPGPTATNRLYITGDGAPKMRYEGIEYPLALPAPATAPTVEAVIAPDETASTFQTVLFAFTWVTDLGEESGPSPLTAPLNWSTGVVRFSGFPTEPLGRRVQGVRIYQSVTSALGTTELYFKGEATLAEITGTYDGAFLDKPLAELIPTAHFSTPTDTMRGLIAMPNGMMVAYDGQELLFSEPYQPHAWPESYRLHVDYQIVGLAAFGSQLAIMTEGTPYRGQGTHPDSFALEKIEENLPCLSARGIVDLGYAAAYPSTSGLVTITAGGAQLITRGLFSRDDWQKLDPASIVAAQFDGRYVMAFTGALPAHPEQAAMIDLTGEQPFLIALDAAPVAMLHEIGTGRLNLMDAAGTVTSWDDPRSTTWRKQVWRSKLYELPYAISFAAIEIIADSNGPADTLSVKVIADGVVRATITTANTPKRLPSGFRASKWEIEVETDMSIATITLGRSLAELASRQ